MKFFHMVLALALVTSLTACNKVVEEAQDMSQSAVSVVTDAAETATESGTAMVDGAENMLDDASTMGETAMEKTGQLMDKAEEAVTALSAASYTDYTANAGAGKKHVLFFHADWCGTCVKWEAKVTAALDSLSADTVILKADYDAQPDLAAEYGVTKQSTAVFINADGSVAKTEIDPAIDSLAAFFGN